MKPEAADTRYRSRILREMNANRENPFNSPPSSTGSHGTVSPTMSSVLSDPDGESTRRLNEDIARLTGQTGGKLQVNLEAAHRKWPEFYGMPKNKAPTPGRGASLDHGKLTSALEAKEYSAPRYLSKYLDNDDESTRDPWEGSKRTRSEMQPRVDNESDLSSNVTKSPARVDLRPDMARFAHQPRTRSPLSRAPQRHSSGGYPRAPDDGVNRVDYARKSQRSASLSRREADAREQAAPQDAAPKSTPANFNTIRKTFPSPQAADSPARNAGGATAQSFFMPDISHLNDFVSGTLRFNGSYKNGVPVFVKHGKVRDHVDNYSPHNHAEVDGLAVPEDEEKIFVSMDMLRKEIEDLQDHDDMVQKHAMGLQAQIDQLQQDMGRFKSRKSVDSALGSRTGSEPETAAHEHLAHEKLMLESQVASLQSRLDQMSQRAGVNEVENNTLSLERDRALKKLQEACENIGELMDKLDSREKELNDTQKKLDATLQMQNNNNDTNTGAAGPSREGQNAMELGDKSLNADITTLRREKQALQEEMQSMKTYSASLRREQESLRVESRSLRDNAQTLMAEKEDLRQNAETAQKELTAAREEIEVLQQDLDALDQERNTLREDNESLVRHNEKYFEENKMLRRENSGFERSLHDLRDENLTLKDEVEFLKQQLDHCRPVGKSDDFSARLRAHDLELEEEDEEPEENLTSAFFVPDITIDENSVLDDVTADDDKGPDMHTQTDKTIEIPDTTGPTQGSLGEADNITLDVGRTASPDLSAKPHKDLTSQGQKVAFSLPDNNTQTSNVSANIANKGSKRRQAAKNCSAAVQSDSLLLPDQDSIVIAPETTRNQSVTLNTKEKAARKEGHSKPQHARAGSTGQTPASQSRHKTTTTTTKSALKSGHDNYNSAAEPKSNCPSLSATARRVLEGLCEHNCKNCVVCSRITAHRGAVTVKEASEGKKRVSVPQPVPVSTRQQQQHKADVAVDEPTMRPSQDPGHALAMVIKGLEDEAAHLKMELARLQARYAELDSSVGRRARKELASELRVALRRLEAKNDQIYALYDVLEGQKRARQAMSEDELEMTVFSITGLSVRDASQRLDLTVDGLVM